MSEIKTLRIQSTHPASQGPWVVIDAADYDPAVHAMYEPPTEPAQPAAAAEPVQPAARPAAGRRKG